MPWPPVILYATGGTAKAAVVFREVCCRLRCMSGEVAVFDLAAVYRFYKQKPTRTSEERVMDSSKKAQHAVIKFLCAEGVCETDVSGE
ncbi:hypothetical protein AVEN_5287-1 [Araneus ventricosus]|uniref:Uncharacterized protein n=1 Tax=Araneus ventricosus TaxID=182803 RepID=A0A4Y2CXJ3_ARAVE|nr:hypothetical protein AVEN_5287-1 [Araneus ventricosus]